MLFKNHYENLILWPELRHILAQYLCPITTLVFNCKILSSLILLNNNIT